ncbi:MAG: STAS domain-containing protein [Nanoarchaeota archaeon]|nr:STAS domain-containing protein [Nanoarchaeota archaeon]MBU1135329.1 STAS domain-containing protein [Nanoarchaeota archaeon]MBU2519921.1 STAS domain-containing protein [Nanoarchaeota archaeon]
MEIATREEKDVLIIDVSGDVDATNSQSLKTKIHEEIEDNKAKILINLSEVPYMDSAGLGLLVSCLKRANQHFSDLKLFGLREEVKSVFTLTRLDKVFQIFEDEETALKSFQN